MIRIYIYILYLLYTYIHITPEVSRLRRTGGLRTGGTTGGTRVGGAAGSQGSLRVGVVTVVTVVDVELAEKLWFMVIKW